MRNDGLALLQEPVGHGDAFVQQAARVVPQVQHQAFERSFAQSCGCFFDSWLVFSLKESTSRNAMPGFTRKAFCTLARGISSRIGSDERLVAAFALDADFDLRAAGALQHVGNLGRGQACW